MGEAIDFALLAGPIENEYVEEWKASGRPVVGYFCAHTPEELLWAAGILPVRLRGTGSVDTSYGDQYLGPFNCSFVRHTLSRVMKGELAFLDGLLVTNSCDHIRRLFDVFTAKERWSNDEIGTTFNTPVWRDGLLFGMSARGNLFCLDAQTGKAAWTDSNRSDRFAAILDVGSVMLALPGTAELIAFKPSDKKYEEVARIKVADTPTYAHPVIAGNRIFVKDKESVTLYAIQ